MRIVFLTLLIAALVTACGQKGPLYLPQDNAAATAPSDDRHEQHNTEDEQ